jgi:hypothetical protein
MRRFSLAASRRGSVPRGVDARVCEASQRPWESLQIIPRRVLGESVNRCPDRIKKYPAARFEQDSSAARGTPVGGESWDGIAVFAQFIVYLHRQR